MNGDDVAQAFSVLPLALHWASVEQDVFASFEHLPFVLQKPPPRQTLSVGVPHVPAPAAVQSAVVEQRRSWLPEHRPHSARQTPLLQAKLGIPKNAEPGLHWLSALHVHQPFGIVS
jgi:hypothetical protein